MVIKLDRSAMKSIFPGRRSRLGRKTEPRRYSSSPIFITGEAAAGSHTHAEQRYRPSFCCNRDSDYLDSPRRPLRDWMDVDDGMKHRCAVRFHTVVTVSQERLGKRVASLSEQRMQEVCLALSFSLGCV